MAEDILSADELEALLASVEEEGGGSRFREKQISEYDFVRPNKLSGDQVRALQHMHETIAQNLTMILSTYLRINLEVSLISLGQLTFDVFRNSLSNPTVINVLSMTPLEEKALVTMDMKLSFSLIDRMLGGEGKSIERIRPLTTIEQSLIDNVSSRFLEKLASGWEQLLEFHPVVESREMDPQFIQVIPSSEMVMVATFSVQAPDELETGEICFCIPFISLDSILGGLGDSFQFASAHRVQTERQRGHLERVVNHTTVPLSVELGRTNLSIDEILSLNAGDILVLDQRRDQPLKALVNGRDKLRCDPGRVGKKATIMINEVLPDEAGELEGGHHG